MGVLQDSWNRVKPAGVGGAPSFSAKQKGIGDLFKQDPIVGPDVSSIDPQVNGRLADIIGQGGIGMDPNEMTSYRRMWENELEPSVRNSQLESDIVATNRGIYDSPVAVGQRGMARQNANSKLQDLWKQLVLANSEAKRQSLSSALAMKQQNFANQAQLELSQWQITEQMKLAQKKANQDMLLGGLESGLDFILK